MSENKAKRQNETLGIHLEKKLKVERKSCEKKKFRCQIGLSLSNRTLVPQEALSVRTEQ